MPPFQLASSSARRSSFRAARLNSLRRDTRAIALHQVKRHVAQRYGIVCAVIVAISRPVLVHGGVENPVEPVFETPMRGTRRGLRATALPGAGNKRFRSSLCLQCFGCGTFLLPPDPSINDVFGFPLLRRQAKLVWASIRPLSSPGQGPRRGSQGLGHEV